MMNTKLTVGDFAKLDNVSRRAFIAFVKALEQEHTSEEAQSAANEVLVAAGRDPLPPMPET